MTRFVYLHGFASGPTSRKAQLFRDRMASELGLRLEIPSLDGGDFERMTITSQLAIVEGAIGGAPCVLIGSSMGGYLSALYASRRPESVRGVVLMAPAFWFADRWEQQVGPEVAARWKREGRREVYHYSRQRNEFIGYGLLEDARRHPPAPLVKCPCLLFHGRQDDVVPLEHSERYAAQNPNVRLMVFEAGHELGEALDAMWTATREFVRSLSR
jgi:uncharacterized protein